MNVTLEELPNCEVRVLVELPPETVEPEWKAAFAAVAAQAKIPGFRPGKAPRSIIESKYGEAIRQRLVNDTLRKLVPRILSDKKLRPLDNPVIKDIVFGDDRSIRFEMSLVCEPPIPLPDYKNFTIEVPDLVVTEEQIDEAIESMRAPHATYEPVEGRPLAMGDFAVIDYSGSLGGKPLKEVGPDLPPAITGKSNFWLKMAPASFLYDFCEKILGMNPGETRSFPVAFPENLALEPISGKTVNYEVSLHSINSQKLPEIDDEFAKTVAQGKTLAELRQTVRERIGRELERSLQIYKQHAILSKLLSSTDFPLPESLVAKHSRNILEQTVRDNLALGVSREALEQHEQRLVDGAEETARGSVRQELLLLRIAEEENIQLEEKEILGAVAHAAQRAKVPLKKYVAELKKNGGIEGIKTQLLVRKTVDHLCDTVKCVKVPPEKFRAPAPTSP